MLNDTRAAACGTTNFAYLLAGLAAVALVSASAGFGGYFAWSTNESHGALLASFAVVMALGLETAKPLAVHGVFTALREWRFGQAAALAVLSFVAIGYSLAAELQLMSRSRADLVATRKHDATNATDARTKLADLRSELAGVAAARTVAELKPLIELKTAATKGNDCDTWLENTKLRAACLELAQLKTEAARADRRAQIAAKIEAAENVAHDSGPAKVADPSATALATYLGALGLNVEANRLGDWLVLVGVFALEVGSMFAAVLVAAFRPNAQAAVLEGVRAHAIAETARNASESRGTPADTVPVTSAADLIETVEAAAPAPAPRLAVPDDPAERLLALLQTQGGEVFGSQRTLALALGISASAVNRVLHSLAGAGRVAVSATPSGTRVKLAA